jgi:hypothetical protein
MANAIIWTISVRAKLNMKSLVYFVTDNTASMSGLGLIGGCCDIIRRSFDLPELVPRGPCALHALHIGVANARNHMYFGPLPAKLDREKKYTRARVYVDCA